MRYLQPIAAGVRKSSLWLGFLFMGILGSEKILAAQLVASQRPTVELKPQDVNLWELRLGTEGIAADGVKDVGVADFTGGNRLAHAQEVRVEAAIRADLQLHAGRGHRGEGRSISARLSEMGFSQKIS